jgi:hypothetical protein
MNGSLSRRAQLHIVTCVRLFCLCLLSLLCPLTAAAATLGGTESVQHCIPSTNGSVTTLSEAAGTRICVV